MLRATIWRDLRWRLLVAALLVVPPAALVAWSYVVQPRGPAAMPDYAAYLDAGWFRLPGPSVVFLVAAVVLGASRTLLHPRDDVAYLLALPVSRQRWLAMHLGASLGALAALVLVCHLVLAAGAWRTGVPLAATPLLGRSLAVLAAACPWIAVTAGVLTVVRYPALALVLVLGTVAVLPPTRFRLDVPARPHSTMLPAWDSWALADPRAWDGRLPVASLLAALALGGIALLLARHRLGRFEP